MPTSPTGYEQIRAQAAFGTARRICDKRRLDRRVARG